MVDSNNSLMAIEPRTAVVAKPSGATSWHNMSESGPLPTPFTRSECRAIVFVLNYDK